MCLYVVSRMRPTRSSEKRGVTKDRIMKRNWKKVLKKVKLHKSL